MKYSSKRLTEFNELQKLTEGTNLKVLKHAPTRWLSLGKCLNRLLTLRDPLKRFFREEVKNQKTSSKSSELNRPQRVLQFLNSYTATSYCYFLDYVIASFDTTNTVLQAEKPLIHKLRRILLDLYRGILMKFLKPVAFQGTALLDVKLDVSYHQRSEEELWIGDDTRNFIAEKKLHPDKIKAICDHEKQFYKCAARYIVKKLPLQGELIKHAEVFDLERLKGMSFKSVKYFLNRFKALAPSCSMDELEEQFGCLQIEELDATILQLDRADQQWIQVGQIKKSSGQRKYPDLVKLATAVLLIPHSNACCERVFSSVRKIRTDFRSTMKAETLDAICTVKMKMQSENSVCYKHILDADEVKLSKKATMEALNKC